MSYYLHDIPLEKAQTVFRQALREANLQGPLRKESIPLDEKATGRTLAEPIWAILSSPHYHASAMDGFAIRAEETIGAGPSTPLVLRVSAEGKVPPQAKYLDTGDPLPDWANAVIPIENTEPVDTLGVIVQEVRSPHAIRIRTTIAPWSHVRPLGEDIVATQLVLPAGHILRPVDLGATAACGHTQVIVSQKPKVAILPTGSELVPIGQPPKLGEIIEYNSLVLAAQVNGWGGEAHRWPITPDNFEDLVRAVHSAAKASDLVLLNAGSSAGAEDFSEQVVEKLGRLLVHGIAVRPGHPVILGMIGLEDRQVPIIGVPGYPVSAALTGEIFVEPLLANWLGRAAHQPETVEAILTRKLTSPGGDDDFVRVAVGKVGERLLAAPLGRGAGVISSLVQADGLAHLPAGVQGVQAGDHISVMLLRRRSEIENSIFVIGSHDILLDVLAQQLAGYNRRLTSANAGSLGGLIALHRQEAHLAGSHLLDPKTGEYNIPYLSQYIPNISVHLVVLAEREQGLIVRRGNPKGVKSLTDLARPDVSFINRQRAAGTRLLLDYELGQMGIASKDIHGYNQEEFTHLAVAAAITAGRADCGLGIAAAAQALDLDFIPLFRERYDLVIPSTFFHSSLLAPLLDILHTTDFRKQASQLPGYHIARMGEDLGEYKP
jgi:putative molybdopterin biosynthesis protein